MGEQKRAIDRLFMQALEVGAARRVRPQPDHREAQREDTMLDPDETEDSYGYLPDDYVAIARALDSRQDTMSLDATMLEGMCDTFVSILHDREDALRDITGKGCVGFGTLYSQLVARGLRRMVEQMDQRIHDELRRGGA